MRTLITGSSGPIGSKICKRLSYMGLSKADIIYEFGMYLPNHANMGSHEINYVADFFKSIEISCQVGDVL